MKEDLLSSSTRLGLVRGLMAEWLVRQRKMYRDALMRADDMGYEPEQRSAVAALEVLDAFELAWTTALAPICAVTPADDGPRLEAVGELPSRRLSADEARGLGGKR